MWISREQWDQINSLASQVPGLKQQIEGLKNQPEIETLRKELADKNTEVDTLNQEIKDFESETETNEEQIEKLSEQIKEKDRKIVRLESDNDLAIREATNELKDQIGKLTTEKNNAEKEVEILRTAFKNLGFDVKDMKEIMSKLVEGVVAKNTVNVIK